MNSTNVKAEAEASPEELTLTFRYLPGGGREAELLQATLPNGAKFVLDAHAIPGKLGANLQLFYQAIKAQHRPEGTSNAITAKPPEYTCPVTKVAPGTATGVSSTLDKLRREASRKAAQRSVQDALDALEISL